MPDIRDVLKGLSPDHRALYTEVRTTMRRAYIAAHASILPIEQYETTDDAFLDLIDIKIALLFDRAGVFNHSDGNLNTEQAKVAEANVEADGASAATKLMQRSLEKPQATQQANGGWGQPK